MRRFLVFLLWALPLAAQTPVVSQTAANSSPSIAITPKAAGDSLLVECDYSSSTASGAVTDSAGTTFTALGAVNSSGSLAQFVALSASLASAAADTVSCPNLSGFAEIYVVELAGAVSSDGLIQTNGSASPASGSIAGNAGDLLVAFCITGTCSNAKGWTSLSAFDRNLVADIAATAANTSASFKTSTSWVLTVVALKPTVTAPPAPAQFILKNCGSPGSTCTFTFPISTAPSLPACATADTGCYLSIQICDTSVTPANCLTLSQSGGINILVNSPTAGIAVVPVVTATSP